MSEKSESRRRRTPRPSNARADFDARFAARRAQFDRANARIAQRTGRNLFAAIGIGLGLGAVLFVSLFFVKEIFVLVAVALLCLAAAELSAALLKSGRFVARTPSIAGPVVVIAATYVWHAAGQWLALLAVCVLACVWRLVQLIEPKRRTSARAVAGDLAAIVFMQVYITFFGSATVLLVLEDGGQWWVMAFLIVVVVTDVGAYASGLLFGKHPMAPRVSPKKTWEGFAGATLLAVISGVLLGIFMLGQPWWFGILFGIVLAISGTVGDLSESLIKRDLGVKDMSSWLPGHGGILDRIDSLLPSAAVGLAFYVLFT